MAIPMPYATKIATAAMSTMAMMMTTMINISVGRGPAAPMGATTGDMASDVAPAANLWDRSPFRAE